MSIEWQEQLREFINTAEDLKQYVSLTPEEAGIPQSTKVTWGTTPFVASLRDPNDPSCPRRDN